MTFAQGAGSETALGTAPTHWLRALWGLEARVQPLPSVMSRPATTRPRFMSSSLWLPAAPLAGVPGSFESYLLAASAHISAHLQFGGPRFEPKALKPVQVALISLIEDARVERLAAARYPGLTRLWAPYHRARADLAKTSLSLLARLARALLDEDYVDEDAWVMKGRGLFPSGGAALLDHGLSRRIGDALANDLGQMRVQFNARDYVVEPAYRDDHVGLWHFAQELTDDGTAFELHGVQRIEQQQPSARRREDLEPEPRRARDARSDEPISTLRLGAASEAAHPLRYAEWDYLIQRERPAFCSLFERPVLPDPSARSPALPSPPCGQRLERAALRLGDSQSRRERRLLDGDRLDLQAVIASVAASRSATPPSPRVYQRVAFRREPPALLLLLDLSESLNAHSPATGSTLLELARSAAMRVATSLTGTRVDLAIHGFSSNGRHDIGYRHFKDFDDPYDEQTRARLAGMRAELSTRLGTALRHAGQALLRRAPRRKLLLVLTDGEPCDIDVHDPKYLLLDAKQATIENRRAGVISFCLALAPHADTNVARMFGMGNYSLLDRVETLPERLTELSLRLSARAHRGP